MMTLEFGVDGAVAAAQLTPSPSGANDSTAGWRDLLLPSGITARSGADYTPQVRLKPGGEVETRGQILKNFTNQRALVVLPEDCWPTHEDSFITVITGTTTTLAMWVRATSGEVMWPAQGTSGSNTYHVNVKTAFTK